jgi:hypothetical protein
VIFLKTRLQQTWFLHGLFYLNIWMWFFNKKKV